MYNIKKISLSIAFLLVSGAAYAGDFNEVEEVSVMYSADNNTCTVGIRIPDAADGSTLKGALKDAVPYFKGKEIEVHVDGAMVEPYKQYNLHRAFSVFAYVADDKNSLKE